MPFSTGLSHRIHDPGTCWGGSPAHRRGPPGDRTRRCWLPNAGIRVLALLAVLGLLAVAAPALAHYPWITVSGDTEQGPTFRLGIGHVFPENGPLAAARLDGIRLVGADGAVQALVLTDRETHPLPEGAGDTGLIVAEQAPVFWSRTREGGRPASREVYPDAFSCTQSSNVMKAVFGPRSGSAWRHRQGHVLELLPQNDPTGLRPGDPLSVRVLFHGEAWEGEVKATHAGYDGRSEDGYALTLRTDADGEVRFVPAVSGYWLVRAHASEDHPDPAVCDRRSYFSTLTFVIR